MKIKWIALSVVAAIIVIAAIVAGFFYPGTPETVSVTEYRGLHSEVEGVKGRMNTAEANIADVQATLEKELPEIRQSITDLGTDITGQIEGLGRTLEGLNEQKAIGEMTVKQAALEKEVAELKKEKEEKEDTSQYPWPSQCPPQVYPPHNYLWPYQPGYQYPAYYAHRAFRVLFNNGGNYVFEIKTRHEVQFYIDEAMVLNKGEVNYTKTYRLTLYLAGGCYHKFMILYPQMAEEPVISWQLD